MLNENDYLIWGSTLSLVIVVIVPLAWTLLHQTLTHAKSINRYSGEMLNCGLNISSNTKKIGSMDITLKSAEQIISLAKSLSKITKTLQN